MREIKFRGQTRKYGEKINMNGDKLPSNWVYGGIYKGNGDFSVIYGENSEGKTEKFVVYTDTVGQYTGLKDKNGVEIYEGDIVFNGVFKAVVEFINGHFYPFTGSDVCSFYPDNTEIIGNVHDNQDLLTTSKKDLTEGVISV